MRLFAKLALISLFSMLVTGCAGVVPRYTQSIDNVQKLKDNGAYSAKVGNFTSDNNPENVNPLRVRANTAASPYDGSFANYLSQALKDELTLADKYSAQSNVEITGTLLKNNVDIGGFSTGYGNIEARFVVKNNGQLRYDQVKSGHLEWESSFAGNIAIPKAGQQYAFVVQQLLANLYADPAFLAALK